jgi:hypothetical protein
VNVAVDTQENHDDTMTSYNPVVYIILEGTPECHRTQPMAMYWDYGQAVAAWQAWPLSITAAMWGGFTAILVAYELCPDGKLKEIQEMGAR